MKDNLLLLLQVGGSIVLLKIIINHIHFKLHLSLSPMLICLPDSMTKDTSLFCYFKFWKPWYKYTNHSCVWILCITTHTLSSSLQISYSVTVFWVLNLYVTSTFLKNYLILSRLCKLQKGCTRLTAASDKVYQLLVHGRWFSPGTPASSTTKTGRHDIAEILLKVTLITKNLNQILGLYVCCQWLFVLPH